MVWRALHIGPKVVSWTSPPPPAWHRFAESLLRSTCQALAQTLVASVLALWRPTLSPTLTWGHQVCLGLDPPGELRRCLVSQLDKLCSCLDWPSSHRHLVRGQCCCLEPYREGCDLPPAGSPFCTKSSAPLLEHSRTRHRQQQDSGIPNPLHRPE